MLQWRPYWIVHNPTTRGTPQLVCDGFWKPYTHTKFQKLVTKCTILWIGTLLLLIFIILKESQNHRQEHVAHSHMDSVCHINTLRPRQDGRHFPDDILKWIFLNENLWISIEISLKFVPKDTINNIPALVQIMAWRRPGDKPLSEPMMVNLLTHICVTRPQRVKELRNFSSVSRQGLVNPTYAWSSMARHPQSGWGLGSFLREVVVTFNHVGGFFNLFIYHHWGCLNNAIFSNLELCTTCVITNCGQHPRVIRSPLSTAL